MAKRNLPTGPAYASAGRPQPPVKPEVVAALEQPDVASDASPIPAHGALGVKSFGPLPPRRPADLDIAAALAGAPMPPARPAELILASTANQAGGAVPVTRRQSIAQHGLLPKVITSGVDTAPTGALALAEAQPAQKFDDSALLARAAELTAPLPPMPIPNVATARRGGAGSSRRAAASRWRRPHSARWWPRTSRECSAACRSARSRATAPAAASQGDLRGPQQ